MLAVRLCLLLGLLTAACYSPNTRNGFVVLDDPTYIYQNAQVKGGLTWAATFWAFTSGYASNWHPLTWLSHMMDYEVFGLNAGGHHFTSLLLHALNTVLVFLVLKKLTGAFWRSALVAALFGWHPTHVESVAWAAERKDVLSTLFFLLTLLAYSRYVGLSRVRGSLAEANDLEAGSTRSAAEPRGRLSFTPATGAVGFYLLSLFLFALGLMSKPMLVTTPCVLLLLDFWPLRRVQLINRGAPAGRVVLQNLWVVLREKLPFFAMSLAASVITFRVQQAGGAVSSLATIPLSTRIANAVISYVRYVVSTVWPVDLSVFYPYPDHWPALIVVGAALVLLGCTGLAIKMWHTRPYLFVGWFWFLGTLVPTIGLVQVGSQAMADRYLYIPSLGLFVMAAWWLSELKAGCLRLKWLVPSVATAAAVACGILTVVQTGYWRSEEALFQHALETTKDNYLAYDHMAKVCEGEGRKEEAVAYYSALLRLKPHYLQGRYNLGTLLMEMGRLDEAASQLEVALTDKPDFAPAHANLGITFYRQNKLPEAVTQLDEAVRLNPKDPDAKVNLGVALLALNSPAKAAESLRDALRLKPDDAGTHILLALALSRVHGREEAVVHALKARDLALASGQNETAAKAEELLKHCQGAVDSSL